MTGKEVREFRKALGMTQEQFGQELGFANPQTSVSRIENGHINPSAQVIKIIEGMRRTLILEAKLEESGHA